MTLSNSPDVLLLLFFGACAALAILLLCGVLASAWDAARTGKRW